CVDSYCICELFSLTCAEPFASFLFVFLKFTQATEIYPLSLHDALPISVLLSPRATAESTSSSLAVSCANSGGTGVRCRYSPSSRSEEHTSELQSRENLVCRLLLEKKKKIGHNPSIRKIYHR